MYIYIYFIQPKIINIDQDSRNNDFLGLDFPCFGAQLATVKKRKRWEAAWKVTFMG